MHRALSIDERQIAVKPETILNFSWTVCMPIISIRRTTEQQHWRANMVFLRECVKVMCVKWPLTTFARHSHWSYGDVHKASLQKAKNGRPIVCSWCRINIFCLYFVELRLRFIVVRMFALFFRQKKDEFPCSYSLRSKLNAHFTISTRIASAIRPQYCERCLVYSWNERLIHAGSLPLSFYPSM